MFRLFNRTQGSTKDDILAGLTVSFAIVPEVVAFAFVAGVDPLVALHSAFIVGIIAALFGGRPAMITGAAGALAVVIVSLVTEGNLRGDLMGFDNLGLYYLCGALLLMGLLQILTGLFQLGRFIRLIPHPVMMGFVNGLAIVIFKSQLGLFTKTSNGVTTALSSHEMFWMITLVVLTMGIMYLLPKLTLKIPAGLTAIVAVSLFSILVDLPVSTVGSFIRDGGGTGLEGGLPSFNFEVFSQVPWSWDTLRFIFPYALILAAVGLIETLMTLSLIDDITETKGNSNRECIAQGTGNLISGLFGGMGGCAMIGQSMISINSGGRGRTTGVVTAIAILTFILFASEYIEKIPMAALVGVMFMVVISTFAWSSFRILNKIPRSDAFVLICVSTLTVIYDLAVAVFAGVIISALSFAWENAKRIRARKTLSEDGTVLTYEIWGPLFFGSITDFNAKFQPKKDPEKIIIDFIESKVSDYSGVDALVSLVEKYHALHKTVILRHLSKDCKNILCKNKPELEEFIQENIDDPRYYVVAQVHN